MSRARPTPADIVKAIEEGVAAGGNRTLAREYENHPGLLRLAERHHEAAKAYLSGTRPEDVS